MGSKKHKDIIIDTSFFIALAKANDTHHEKAKKLAKFHSKKVWITTWPVITELSHILSTNPFLALLEEQQKGLFTIFSVLEDTIPRMIELKKRYLDHDLDLADISLILLAEHLGHGSILTFDINDFSYLKWNKTHSFQLNEI